MKTFGMRKPVDDKVRYYEEHKEDINKRYYPKNTQGNIDEWRALERQMQEAANDHTQKRQDEVRQNKQLYGYAVTTNMQRRTG